MGGYGHESGFTLIQVIPVRDAPATRSDWMAGYSLEGCRYLRERRVNGEKRIASEVAPGEAQQGTAKRPRGRPKGSKNRGNKGGNGGTGGAV